MGQGLPALLAAALLMAACSAPRPPPATESPAAVAATTGALDPVLTELRILVGRDGPMASLGHNHVITGRSFTGAVTPENGEYRFDLALPVATLVVDDPAVRATAGPEFAAPVDDAARAGTRTNMLGEQLLDAARFPAIGVKGRTVTGGDGARSVVVTIKVRDATREFRIPVTVQDGPAGPVLAGELRLRHADLGLTPFAALGGLLRVRDELALEFRVGLAAGA